MCGTGRGWGGAREWVGEQSATASAGVPKLHKAAERRGSSACRADRRRALGPVDAPHIGHMRSVKGRESGLTRASDKVRHATRVKGLTGRERLAKDEEMAVRRQAGRGARETGSDREGSESRQDAGMQSKAWEGARKGCG